MNKEIYLSYAWEKESEEIADQIMEFARSKNLHVKRDKNEIGYKGNIREFMKSMGGSLIIVIISDNYLKSQNCMFEMLEIYRNKNIWNRIFPIILPNVKIYDEFDRIDYLNYWDDKLHVLKDKVSKMRDMVGKVKVTEKLSELADITRVIDEIADMLRNMNTLTLKGHINSNFDNIFQNIGLLVGSQLTSTQIDKIKNLVGKGKLKQAIHELVEISKGKSIETEALKISSEYENYMDARIKNIQPTKSYPEILDSVLILVDDPINDR